MKTPYQICMSILMDTNIQTDKSPTDMSYLTNYDSYFREIFELDKAAFEKWWDEVDHRSDISDDDKWEIVCLEDEFNMLLNLRDNLKNSGVF